jgi:hypothetical protein
MTETAAIVSTHGSRRPASTKRVKIQGQGPADIAADATDSKNLLTTKKKAKPAYLQSLSQSEKAENFKIIDNMNKKIAYMKNPRYKVSKAPITMTTVSTRNNFRPTATPLKPKRLK